MATASATGMPERIPSRAACAEHKTMVGFGPGLDNTTALSRSSGLSRRSRCRGQIGKYTHITRFIADLQDDGLPVFAAPAAHDLDTQIAASGVFRCQRRDQQ